jgi:acyl dehydratase
MTVRLDGEAAVRAAAGSDLGASEWYEITADRVQAYIDATGDPDGTYFAVGLSNMFLPQIVTVEGFSLGVNYGTQAITLGAPLCDGDRVRGSARLVDVTDVRDGLQTLMVVTIERDGAANEPACVIESLSRWLDPGRSDER